MSQVSPEIAESTSPTILIDGESTEVQCDRGTLPAELAGALDRCGDETTLVGVARDGNVISVSITVAPENAAADGGF